jgi:hypothetical protein
MVGHRLKHRPGHDLKKRAIERRRNATRVRGACTGGMDVIQIRARPKDQNKLRKRAAAFRQSGFIRRQVPRDNVSRIRDQRAEIPAATQVRSRIDLLGTLAKVK